MTEVRILIVEDEPLIAEDIASQLENNDFIVAGIAYSKDDALAALETKLPDLVLLDINLNGEPDGIAIADKVNSFYNIPFIYLTSYSDRATLETAKHTEPSGYIVKPFNESGLFSAIEIALYNHAQKNKRKYPEPSLAAINKHLQDPVSEREFALLQLIYEGQTNRQIAETLFISPNTVKKHINHAYLKLDVHSRSAIIARLRQLMQI